jgi:hypothetical protein
VEVIETRAETASRVKGEKKAYQMEIDAQRQREHERALAVKHMVLRQHHRSADVKNRIMVCFISLHLTAAVIVSITY